MPMLMVSTVQYFGSFGLCVMLSVLKKTGRKNSEKKELIFLKKGLQIHLNYGIIIFVAEVIATQ